MAPWTRNSESTLERDGNRDSKATTRITSKPNARNTSSRVSLANTIPAISHGADSEVAEGEAAEEEVEEAEADSEAEVEVPTTKRSSEEETTRGTFKTKAESNKKGSTDSN